MSIRLSLQISFDELVENTFGILIRTIAMKLNIINERDGNLAPNNLQLPVIDALQSFHHLFLFSRHQVICSETNFLESD